ncbi:thioredoxin domain [Bacillus phage DK3]|uniref:Glutaredoxin n=1 Tax=Bacillus phage DK3 TaxID=2500810 RepID=A0A3T0IJ66_9CAUD|nr:thioredoxin domain [Bacillus phage DK3]AZU99804.1 glutaredoxin [Bacillus phage DK3]
MKIIMYTKDKCPNCERAKFMLNYSPVPVDLEIRNIESGKDAELHKSVLVNMIKSNSLPTLLIPDKNGSFDDGENYYNPLIGFDENLGVLQEVLGL